MKALFLISSFILTHLSLFSQTYSPFPTDSAVWKEIYYDGSGGGVENRYYQFTLSKDTLLQGKIWKKLLKSGEKTCYNMVCIANNYTITQGFIREENKKIYLRQLNDSIVTLYDFDNLKIGDTLINRKLLGQNASTSKQVISEIDSIQVGVTWRKRYKISNTLGNLYLIEGIGSTKGLMPSYNEFEQGIRTVCVRVGLTTILGDSPCNIINSTSEFSIDNIFISPNPANEILIINGLSNDLTKNIVLSNAFGQVVKIVKIENEKHEIEIKGFPNGLYVCQILDGQKRILSFKFVVSH